MMVERSRRILAAVHDRDELGLVSLDRLLDAGLERLGLRSGSLANQNKMAWIVSAAEYMQIGS
jgi:hypothetical protein